MSLRTSNVIDFKDVLIYVGSWNVNGKEEDFEKMSDWLNADHLTQQPHVVVIGLQEMIELSATNIFTSTLVDDMSEASSEKWNSLMQRFLNAKGLAPKDGQIYEEYEKLCSHHLVGIFLSIFVIKSIRKNIRGVQSAVVARGVGGLGNKGGVCIRMELFDSSVCFVCSHLTAHQHLTVKRNEDFEAIIQGRIFQDQTLISTLDSTSYSANNKDSQTSHYKKELTKLKGDIRHKANSLSQTQNIPAPPMNNNIHNEPENPIKTTLKSDKNDRLNLIRPENSEINTTSDFNFSVNDHDVIIWFGDLNYRIELGPSLSEVYEMIYSNALTYLLQIDQLNLERAAGRVFQGFEEGYISFRPTYMFIPGTGLYDNRVDGKLRIPAWCDRILWRTNSAAQYSLSSSSNVLFNMNESMELLNYRCGENVLSDHKPIAATLRLRAKSKNIASEEMFLYKRGKPLLESVIEPRIHFEPHFLLIQEGQSPYSIRLLNPTDKVCRFNFNSDFIPSWLQLRPRLGSVPGKAHIDIKLSIVYTTAELKKILSHSHDDIRTLTSVSHSSTSNNNSKKFTSSRKNRYPGLTLNRHGPEPVSSPPDASSSVDEHPVLYALLCCVVNENQKILFPISSSSSSFGLTNSSNHSDESFLFR